MSYPNERLECTESKNNISFRWERKSSHISSRGRKQLRCTGIAIGSDNHRRV